MEASSPAGPTKVHTAAILQNAPLARDVWRVRLDAPKRLRGPLLDSSSWSAWLDCRTP